MAQSITIILVFIFTYLVLSFAYFMWRMREPANNPRKFLKQGGKPSTQKLVVCAGDSITHGAVSANYVQMLQRRFESASYEFVNAGINGNLAWNVLQRLDDIIACQSDVVTLLVGTNDVNATFDEQWENQYRREQGIPEKPTLEWYRQNIEKILERIQSETDAQMAILSLPMLGENLDSEMNQKIKRYNSVLRELADEKAVIFLDLHQELVNMMSANHISPPYDGKLGLMGKAMFQRAIFRQSWDAIARTNNLQLLTDHIHLNDKGAKAIADLIGEFLSQ